MRGRSIRQARSVSIGRIVLFAALVLLDGCSSNRPAQPEVVNSHLLAVPHDEKGVGNFAQVSGALFRGEQPTREGFVRLKQIGVRTIVDLRGHDDSPQLRGLGLRYVHIPENALHITDTETAAFLKIVEDPHNQPVFVHCQHGADRTGCAVAAYRIVAQGWERDSAIAELHNFHFHSIFVGIPDYLRNLDAAAMKARIASIAEPQVKTIP